MRLDSLHRFFAERLWSAEPLPSRALDRTRGLLQAAFLVGEGFVRDQLLLRSHALTFLTVLSLVPMLALAVSMVKLLGVSEDLTRTILEQVAAGSPEAVDRILPYVERVNFRAMGTIGAVSLLLTTILTVGSVERSLNAIWGLTKQRPWVRRIPDYLAVVIVSPLLLGVAISLRTTFESQWIVRQLLAIPVFDFLYHAGLRQAPTILVIAGISFLYWFLPNTEVRARSALLGGLVAGLLFSLAQRAYLGFSVGAARYDVLFGTLAFLPLLLVWVYFSWAIILLGAEVAYAHQTLPLYRREVRGSPPGSAARETLGLAISLQLARAFRGGYEPWTGDALSDVLDVPVRVVREVVGRLEAAGIARSCGRDQPVGAFQLGRPAERIRLADVLAAIRGPREMPLGPPAVAKTVEQAQEEIEGSAARVAEARTLRDLLEILESSEQSAASEP